MITPNILFFAISGIFLVISGIFLVKSLEKIARFLHISEYSAAFIIMAFATSIPELLVGINSAIQGNPALSLGNVIGANIIDLTLLVGIFVILNKGIQLKRENINRGTYFMFSSILLMFVLYLIGNSLSRIDGVILVSLFFVNTYLVFKDRKKYSAKFNKLKTTAYQKVNSLLLFVVSLIVLFISSNLAVKYAHLIAIDLQIPQMIIGLFLLSIATTLPELIFGINAVLLKHPQMAIGDQIGTIVMINSNVAAALTP